ncbi:tetratricopeptide repeat protein [Teredinibacter turnerae]|uniref:tetratricopeptide repeat protein n=1 Tax=Teredinibacter turnerae TaxID=2426 RepID=UPI00039DBD96|nr:tetratricopeptide repeat protein [Teredinibacter turnerae]
MRRTFFRRLMVVATVCFFSLAINGFAAEDKSPLATDSSWQDDNQRGITAYHKKKYTQAEHYYQQALQASPNNAEVLNNYALVLHQLGRSNDAIAVSNQSIDHTDNAKAQANAYFNKGRALESLERNKDALSAYEQAQRLAGTSARKEAVERLRAIMAGNAGSSKRREDSSDPSRPADKTATSGERPYRPAYGNNPNLQLCEDFLDYLNRNAHLPLYCDLVEDPEFTDFKLPVMKPAPDDMPFRFELALREFSHEGDKPLSQEEHEKLVANARKYAQSGRYRVLYVDLDHNGEKDRLIYRDDPALCKEKKIGIGGAMIYSENWGLDLRYVRYGRYIRQRGQIFLYKGRAYSVIASAKNYQIHEVKSSRNVKFAAGNPICYLTTQY